MGEVCCVQGSSEAPVGLFRGGPPPACTAEGLSATPGRVWWCVEGLRIRKVRTVMSGQVQVQRVPIKSFPQAPEAQVFAKNFLENDSGPKA